MCRLFGFRARTHASVTRLLLESDRSLLALSREHQHGWGIGSFREGDVVLKKGASPAYADPDFARAAREAFSTCVLAHVRRRSVGELGVENNHPFRHGRLLFAHNGTVRDFERLKLQIESAIKPRFARLLEGSTDSERCFLLFLGHLDDMGALDAPRLDDLATALARTVSQIRALPAPKGEPHLLTFVVTDGSSLVAVRAGEKELWISSAAGDKGLAHLLVASEPLSQEEEWLQIPDEQIVGVDSAMNLHRWALSGPSARPLS
ncbi:MAG: class II glutamine amidotransferase [Myxococcales bacterium]|jgi:predicted glutamine amidotransferase